MPEDSLKIRGKKCYFSKIKTIRRDIRAVSFSCSRNVKRQTSRMIANNLSLSHTHRFIHCEIESIYSIKWNRIFIESLFVYILHTSKEICLKKKKTIALSSLLFFYFLFVFLDIYKTVEIFLYYDVRRRFTLESSNDNTNSCCL